MTKKLMSSVTSPMKESRVSLRTV
jgi:hypothetical protein